MSLIIYLDYRSKNDRIGEGGNGSRGGRGDQRSNYGDNKAEINER